MKALIEVKDLSLLFIYKSSDKSEKLLSKLSECFNKVDVLSDAYDAISSFKNGRYDIVIINYFLDNSDEFIKNIRLHDLHTPIVLLNNELSKSDLLHLLDKNINGFINFKLPINEIIELLHNIMLKYTSIIEEIADAYYCYDKKNIIYNSQILQLSKHESQLLELLLNRRGYIVYYSEIEYELWQSTYMSMDALKSLVKKLRKKIPPKQLINVANEGYKLL